MGGRLVQPVNPYDPAFLLEMVIVEGVRGHHPGGALLFGYWVV
jgi:hypothetical protein